MRLYSSLKLALYQCNYLSFRDVVLDSWLKTNQKKWRRMGNQDIYVFCHLKELGE